MTTDLFVGHLSTIPSLQAERTLAMVGALHPTQESIDRLLDEMRGDEPRNNDAASSQDGKVMPFRLKIKDPNGLGNFDGWLTGRDFREKVGTALTS